jgi:hypothetical protein
MGDSMSLSEGLKGIRTVVTEYADGKNVFSSGTKRAKMDALFEEMGKEMSSARDVPRLVVALTAKYKAQVDKIAAG